ncbi:Ras guanyl-releasing protein 3 [Stenotrophomonas acidaminiphila]|uniref:Ras guanyl-releasing protein 3 n=1 Tax=Stenotrophomonas acidaminiphila TaxID=128780 RepID=A0A0S1B2K0_9GAMM|nr:EF-hand domain-containing protein [Stenotrophomonas acidaminiphila]ALJ29290.1 Ras guanyl-releasing protein 3 [Stenotrophomonas acidaminiphila]
MIRPCLPTLALLLAATAALPALAQHAPRDSAVTAPLPAAPAGVRAQPLASGAVTHQVRLPGEPGQATVIVRSIQPDSVAGNYRIDFQALDVDGDGFISREEAQANPALADEFSALDSARRGKLAREQLAGWLVD